MKKGIVKFFNETKGFGFIKDEENLKRKIKEAIQDRFAANSEA